ncbi:MAG: ATP synthase subunit a [Candidatus Gottesmanbacteria bacterium GW2011_GWC2_39_8]|uniref:ATP synthase subunit a n=1 Tax=Candidatus Gottesmanbacteria bacterium GW2011_GWC2_39_8 TaxID=1618450 RepID=A0A0G0PSQ9_9BACT|nr:MAG: ATP synthase subunit a [Candidatus Gottesmanbacteria bacterium GW2011_GWC2_39_8]
MSELHISISAEKIAGINGFPITNSLIATWMAMFFLFLLTFIVRTRLSLVPGRIQSVMETMVGGIYNLFESINGEKVKIFFPLLGTLFIFIITANWMSLLPGIGTIGLYEIEEGRKVFIPLLRGATADLNTTIGLAIVAMLVIQFYGIKDLGVEYLKKFFNFKSPIGFYVGVLELISEVSRLISFAFRLFGNIFAGEVLLTVIAFLMPVIAPIPFLGLEVFVGFIQALVFSMLTSVFLNVATSKAHH